MKLYSFHLSTAAFRVRIALNLKGIRYETVPVHLLRDGGEHHNEAYRRVNPQGLIPALVTDAGFVLNQSNAICEYLEETHPEPALLPSSAAARAYVRALVGILACDIGPLNGLRVGRYLIQQLHVEDAQRIAWSRHWIHAGLRAIDELIASSPYVGRYCCGDTISLAEVFLVPQWITGKALYQISPDNLRKVPGIVERCLEHPAIQSALPEAQPDAPTTQLRS
jgi:maleylacetoacetate isomerase